MHTASIDNLRAGLLTDREDPPSRDLVRASEYAREVAMGDMDGLCDFLYGACSEAIHVESERIARFPALIPARLEAADTAQVLHILMNDEDPAVVMAARRELVNRWLRDRGLQ